MVRIYLVNEWTKMGKEKRGRLGRCCRKDVNETMETRRMEGNMCCHRINWILGTERRHSGRKFVYIYVLKIFRSDRMSSLGIRSSNLLYVTPIRNRFSLSCILDNFFFLYLSCCCIYLIRLAICTFYFWHEIGKLISRFEDVSLDIQWRPYVLAGEYRYIFWVSLVYFKAWFSSFWNES